MARIRTIKPGFFANEGLATVSEPAQILAGGLLCYADDEGYFNANPLLVKAAVFPLREPSESIPLMLDALAKIGYVRFGVGRDGRRYGYIIKFSEHQKVSHAIPSKIKTLIAIWEDSGSIPEDSGRIPEDSVKTPEVLRPELNRIEKEFTPLTPQRGATAESLASQKDKNPELDITPAESGQSLCMLLGISGMQRRAIARDACAAVKRRKPEMRFTEIPEFVQGIWREYDGQSQHSKLSLMGFLGELGRFMDSDSWRAQPSRASPELDERGGHFEGTVYVTKDGKRMPGYIPPPKAATS